MYLRNRVIHNIFRFTLNLAHDQSDTSTVSLRLYLIARFTFGRLNIFEWILIAQPDPPTDPKKMQKKSKSKEAKRHE